MWCAARAFFCLILRSEAAGLASRRLGRTRKPSRLGRPRPSRRRAFARLLRMRAHKRKRSASLHQLRAGERLEILVEDLLLLVLRQVERIQDAQRLADVAGALLGVEWAIGREQDLLGRIETHAQHGPGIGAEHRGIDVEVFLEIIERTLFQAALERLVIGVRGARADLIPAGADAPLQHRHDAAEMMHDQLEAGIVVERLGEDEASHGGRGLIRPAERPPDLVKRFLLVEIVGEVGAASWMVQVGLPSLVIVAKNSAYSGRSSGLPLMLV